MGVIGTPRPGNGGAREGAGKPLDAKVTRWREWIRDRLWERREAHLRLAERRAGKGEAALLCKLYEKALPTPQDPAPGPAPSPPFVLLIGQNGGQIALGYSPQGVVPGMERFMPAEVQAQLPPAGNGHKSGRGKR